MTAFQIDRLQRVDVTSVAMAMDPDSGLRLLGKYSRWQLICYFTLCFGFGMPFAWMMMSIVFIGDVPNYRCALAPNTTLNESIPASLVDGVLTYETCSMYAEPGVYNTTVPCQHGYWYDPASGYDSTLITEWDLVCGKESLVEISMLVNGVGNLIGSVLCNWLADKYGRKWVFLGCMWSNAVIAMTQAFSPSMTFFTVLSFLDGIQQQGMGSVCFIMCLELFPTEQRTFAGNAIEFMWVLGYVMLTPIAYGLRNWRHLQLAISVPLLATVSFYWILSESIPWLVSNGKLEEADKVMKKAARWNKISIPKHVFTTDETESSEKSEILTKDIKFRGNSENVHLSTNSYIEVHNEIVAIDEMECTILDALKSPKLRFYIIVFVFVWFVDSMGYTAISLTVTYLPGNRYLNFFLYSIIETPGYALTWLLTAKIGRRPSMVIFHFIAGFALIATVIQTQDFKIDVTIPVIILSVIGKCFIAASYATLYLYTPEVFPTNIRSTSMGVCAIASNVAVIISPFARTLHRSIPWLPPVIIGVLFVIAGCLSFLFPETMRRQLPNTIMEVENWTQKRTPTVEADENNSKTL